jgi:hypothetical protein
MLVLTATSTWALEDESFDSIPGPTITIGGHFRVVACVPRNEGLSPPIEDDAGNDQHCRHRQHLRDASEAAPVEILLAASSEIAMPILSETGLA